MEFLLRRGETKQFFLIVKEKNGQEILIAKGDDSLLIGDATFAKVLNTLARQGIKLAFPPERDLE